MTEKKYFYNQHKNEYTQEYIRQNYKQLSIRLPKEGEITCEKIAAAADKAGMSVNGYIMEAVREKMVREGVLQNRTDVLE